MNRDEAIKLVETTKGISPFTRAFVFWLYRNGYYIKSPKEIERETKGLLYAILKNAPKEWEDKRIAIPEPKDEWDDYQTSGD